MDGSASGAVKQVCRKEGAAKHLLIFIGELNQMLNTRNNVLFHVFGEIKFWFLQQMRMIVMPLILTEEGILVEGAMWNIPETDIPL